MDKRLHFDGGGLALKASLCPPVLPEGMEFIDEKFAFGLKDPRGLREDMGKILNVLQNQVADHQIIRRICGSPFPGEVCHLEADIRCSDFLSSLLDHPL